ncbi:MAG: glycoside hydrolase family 3 C-terminal domain-containing protein [Salinivirgaceae bacterium]|jgi:beta-glucosidase|nr:glycoside hydrolase family 3 C-terminal domain-containing protein [Salinivirgaceae bacterium]
MKIIILLTSIIILSFSAFSQYKYPFQNPNMDTEARIDNLLSLMTLDEKVSSLSTNPDVLRLGLKGTGHVEGLHGLTQGGPAKWGHPKLIYTTTFPQSIGLAQTWDTAAIKKAAQIEAYETRYVFQSNYKQGGLVVRAPNADIGRDIRWGRTEECYGEDAWFNAQMVVQFIKGLQGSDSKYWMTASLMKHFMANSNENSRDSSSSNFNERLFREYYSYPFYKGIKEGGSRAYMASYNAYNGTPMTIHPMLKKITVDEWGQNGIICTDGGAYRLLYSAHHQYADMNLTAEACIKAGINQFLDRYREGVYGALANGYLDESDLDDVLRGVYRVMIKLGQLDPDELVPYKSIGKNNEPEPWNSEKHKKSVLELTKKSIVLLKNENRTLPLNQSNLKSIAVIGELADTVMLDWYSGTPPYNITLLEALKTNLGSQCSIKYEQNNNYNSAVEIAQNADIAIVMVGNNPTCGAGWKQCPTPSDGKEAVDRKSIELEQEALIQRVYKANPNTIVILQSSFPYAINWTNQNIPAILHITHNSQETGNALFDVLFGHYNPAGRLVQTWPTSIDHLPPMLDYDITKGRTYMYSTHKPLYEFGFGLSYSTFTYNNLKVNKLKAQPGEIITVTVDVKNNGSIDGDEVVQLYVSHLSSSVERPIKELKAFNRINIKQGKKVSVKLNLNTSELAYWDSTAKKFIVEKGEIKLLIGSSSEDIQQTTTIFIE